MLIIHNSAWDLNSANQCIIILSSLYKYLFVHLCVLAEKVTELKVILPLINSSLPCTTTVGRYTSKHMQSAILHRHYKFKGVLESGKEIEK